jgi:uncharacterized membrane protein YsdA (DUF1294 family)
MSYLVLAVLLPMPVYAAHRLGANPVWVGSYLLIASAIAYWLYAIDKRRAEEGLWRIPEAQLHLLEILGGWPGAFLAQRRLRHKCSKGSYQVTFWLIVLIYQFAAFDSFQGWRYFRATLNYIERPRPRP